MILRSMDFDDDGDLLSVTVKMTAAEAALIARMVGKLNTPMANEIVPGIGENYHGPYDVLVGEVFNRIYDSGVDEYIFSPKGS